jgi:hypothetical protein
MPGYARQPGCTNPGEVASGQRRTRPGDGNTAANPGRSRGTFTPPRPSPWDEAGFAGYCHTTSIATCHSNPDPAVISRIPPTGSRASRLLSSRALCPVRTAMVLLRSSAINRSTWHSRLVSSSSRFGRLAGPRRYKVSALGRLSRRSASAPTTSAKSHTETEESYSELSASGAAVSRVGPWRHESMATPTAGAIW